MKKLTYFPVLLSLACSLLFSQSNFSVDAYSQFLNQNKDLTYLALTERFPLKSTYYKFAPEQIRLNDFLYFDSVMASYHLTEEEIALLKQNHFVVTERLTFDCFGEALHDIYINDLPVFLSTDAVLHALHASYYQILSDVELSLLKPNLRKILDGLYHSFSLLAQKYEHDQALSGALGDVDIYVTMARSLLDGQQAPSQYIAQAKIDTIWQAIASEQVVNLKLFADRFRSIDGSQFKVRGHYTRDGLPEYFKAMMWLGRIDFFLTPPPENPWEAPWSREEIRRMNLAAFMLDELLDMAGVRPLLKENDQIIRFLVGESDNLTPAEINDLKTDLGLTDAGQLLDDDTYDLYQETLRTSGLGTQKILSQIMMMNPFDPEPGRLPLSFRLLGQRFIIDSYIFFNVVFDRIEFQGEKVWRPLPDPLDVMFVLGNDDALYLLKDEIETYRYASQLNALRYLVDAYDESFWEASLYNVWLNAIRTLNPQPSMATIPDFMKTAAWRQNKLNTQLASWSQLRHDNLLYAKQSYTGAAGCSYPYSLIEPNPPFYAAIRQFAQMAYEYFRQFGNDENFLLSNIQNYFARLNATMTRLEQIAQKELAQETLNADEIDWLQRMLFINAQSGAPPFDGWYAWLYYVPEDASKEDYPIADVHTQPTDQTGEPVGHVLHVGTGKINLGIFLAPAPYENHPPVAFVGPVMSYYQTITDNFKRMTDEEWAELVKANKVPQRPDWVNIYLADAAGKQRLPGRELPARIYTSLQPGNGSAPQNFVLYQNFPNPFNPQTTIRYHIAEKTHVKLTIYNLAGEKIVTLVDKQQTAGEYRQIFNGHNLPSGIYIARLKTRKQTQSIKMALIR
ncbi:hypothetical protein Calab_3467 [Caldithrix abyssi DSM 13497]|nr:DUF3160 domain-containing protein [Caldithrix abyssi]EHO43066.1 hypothetical protein Calab_3467 [Caldithrix abyssi DSM 13497]